MNAFIKWYSSHLTSKPITVNCVTTGILFGCGDTIAQTIPRFHTLSEGEIPEYSLEHDFKRTARAMFYGGFVFGPLGTTWYSFLAKVRLPHNIQGKTPSSTKKREVIMKVALDQLILAPLASPMYYTVMGILEGKSSGQIKASLSRNYIPTLLANWTLWPPVQFLNFYYIPLQHRLLVVNSISVGWNASLSYRNSFQHVLPPPIM